MNDSLLGVYRKFGTTLFMIDDTCSLVMMIMRILLEVQCAILWA